MSEIALQNGFNADAAENHIADLYHFNCRLVRDLKSLNEKHENAKGKIEDMDTRILHLETKEKSLQEKNTLLSQKLQECEPNLKKRDQEMERLTQRLESSNQTSEALTAENNRITEEVFHHKKTLDVIITEKADADKTIKAQTAEIANLQNLLESSGKALSTSVQWILRYGEALTKLGKLKGERDKSAIQAYSQFHENLCSRTLSENILISAGISAPFGAFPLERIAKKDASTSPSDKFLGHVDHASSPIVIPSVPASYRIATSDSDIDEPPAVMPVRERTLPLPASPIHTRPQSSPHSSQFASPRPERNRKSSIPQIRQARQPEVFLATVNLLDNPMDSTLLFSFSVSSLMEVVNVYMDVTRVDWVYKDSIAAQNKQSAKKKTRCTSSDEESDSVMCSSPPRKRIGVQRSPRKRVRKTTADMQPRKSPEQPIYLSHCSKSNQEKIPLVSLSSESEATDDTELVTSVMTTNGEATEKSPDGSQSNKMIEALGNLDIVYYNPEQSLKYAENLKEALSEAYAANKIDMAIDFTTEFLTSRRSNPLKSFISGTNAVDFLPADESTLLKAYNDLNNVLVLDLLASKVDRKLALTGLSTTNYAALCRMYASLRNALGDLETLKNWCFQLFLNHPVIGPFLFANVITAVPQLWEKFSSASNSAKYPVVVLKYLICKMPDGLDEDLWMQVKTVLQKFYDPSNPGSPVTIAGMIVSDFHGRSTNKAFADEVISDYVLSFRLLASRFNWAFIRDDIVQPKLLPLLNQGVRYIRQMQSSAVALALKLIHVLAEKKDDEGYALAAVKSALFKMKRSRNCPLPVIVLKELYLAQYHLHLSYHKTKDVETLRWLKKHNIEVKEHDS